ncbi:MULTISPECIES: XRE family transcriptional regulator [unclassified Frankia]|uniref:XRE family transcriptional regulator n=1 Tax=unclassified Frankia TaxID=2632575 RepID=UPI001EF54E3B|nr:MULTISPECIES: XRE family transcriptional regulator [unclassified Frankia]
MPPRRVTIGPLQHARQIRGLSLARAAEEIRSLAEDIGRPWDALTAQRLSEYEGGKRPSWEHCDLLSRYYCTNVVALGWACDYAGPETGTLALMSNSVDDGEARWADADLDLLWRPDGLAVGFEEVTANMERRKFLSVSGVALTSVAHHWLMTDSAGLAAALEGKRVNDSLVAGFERRVDTLRKMDDVLGGDDIYELSMAELRVAVRVLRTALYGHAHEARLYAVAAELARIAGWAAFDSGYHGGAQRLWMVALRAAGEAGQPALGANILRCMAEQAAWYGDPNDAVTMLRSAQAGARAAMTATEKAAISGALALAYGRAGESTTAARTAEDAVHLISQSQPAEDPPHIYWCVPSCISLFAGEALLASGDGAAAIPYLDNATDGLAGDFPRARVEAMTRLGVAHVQAGDADAAIQLGHQAVEQAALLDSGMAGRDVATLCREIERTGCPGAADLTDHARVALTAVGAA